MEQFCQIYLPIFTNKQLRSTFDRWALAAMVRTGMIMIQKILAELTDKHKQLIGSTALVFFQLAVTAFSSVSLEIKNKFATKNKKTPLIPAKAM